MSDKTVETGAPAAVLDPSKGGVSRDVNLPPKVRSYASEVDRSILRLNKLLASPGGLASFLGTFNYTLYLLAFVESKSPSLKARLYTLLNRPAPPTTVATTHFASLGALLSSARTTLRLFGLFPMYAWGRDLLKGPKPGQDSVLYSIAVVQCTLYTMFQFLENVALLTDHAVLSPSFSARWNPSGSTAKIYFWSYRAWLGGVLCDFVRLGREAQLTSQRRAERSNATLGEEAKDLAVAIKEEDAKWWADALVPAAWLPMAVQFGTEGGVPGWNLGLMALSGLGAYAGRFAGQWEATKDV